MTWPSITLRYGVSINPNGLIRPYDEMCIRDSLLVVLQKLVDKGNTVLIIEHNMDVIKVADYVIDLGPEGGGLGGEIIAEGTPEKVATVKGSYTGHFLKMELGG